MSSSPDSSRKEASGEAPRRSLLAKTRRGALVEFLGYGSSMIIRLGSNLILTRMLFPEAFGVMAMVQVVLYGLVMLSDVGISQSVVMSARGDDRDYLDTAWTVQVMRGVGLWLCACLLTYPISIGLDEPELLWVLPIACSSAAIHGFSSTRVFTLRRRLDIVPLQKLELGTQLLQVLVCIAAAWLGLGVGALVIAHLISTLANTAASHFLPDSTHRNRFCLEQTARAEMFAFGRWIFLSSALTFLVVRSDQVLLSRWLGSALLGVYNVGQALAEVFDTLTNRLASGVFYPTLARIHNENPGDVRRAYYDIRRWFDALLFTGLGGFAAMSQWIVDLLYDDRYAEAGTMMNILAFRTAAAMLATVCEACLVAQGASIYSFRYNAMVAPVTLLAMPLGGFLGGTTGLLWGAVIARASGLLVLWPAAWKCGFLRLEREALALVYLGFGYALGWLALAVLPEPP